MKKAMLGRKLGMTQIFSDEGLALPVTVIETGPCVVVQIKTKAKEGYNAIKVGYGEIAERKLNKPDLGQYKKVNVTQRRKLREFRLDDISSFTVGQEIKVEDIPF